MCALQNQNQGSLRELYIELKNGGISRRAFVQRASMLGVGSAGVTFLANVGTGFAQEDVPEITEGEYISKVERVSYRPEVGTEDQERGAGGDLNILQWQAPTMLSPHAATGDKDFLSSVLVLEPLMHYAPDSTMIPNLIEEIPSQDNGGLNDNLTEVVFKLMRDVERWGSVHGT